MKKLIAFTALLPGAALAHGAHAPVAEPAHGAIHAAPALTVLAIVLITGAALVLRNRP